MENTNIKMTEDQVITHLVKYLERNNWKKIKPNFSNQHGRDLVAIKDGQTIVIEAKGARGNPKNHHTTRKYFDAGQIKHHYGVALMQTLVDMEKNPDYLFGIAQPFDEDIIKNIGGLIKFLKPLNIKHFWVYPDGKVVEV